jgi:hypothetical protein
MATYHLADSSAITDQLGQPIFDETWGAITPGPEIGTPAAIGLPAVLELRLGSPDDMDALLKGDAVGVIALLGSADGVITLQGIYGQKQRAAA